MKKKWMIPVAAGFLTLYLLIMLACTYMVRGKYLSEFAQDFQENASAIEQNIQETYRDSGQSREWKEHVYRVMAASPLHFSKYQQYTVGIYDEGEQLSVQTGKALGVYLDGETFGAANCCDLQDDLTEEELCALAYYCANRTDGYLPEKYRFMAKISDEQKLLALLVQECVWTEDTGEKEKAERDPLTGEEIRVSNTDEDGRTAAYVKTASSVVWEWGDTQTADAKWRQISLYLPGISFGYDAWERWCGSSFLQNALPENPGEYYRQAELTVIAPRRFQPRTKADYEVMVRLPDGNERPCYFTLASECRPWAAAMDYMKYIYLAGILLTFFCIGTVCYAVFRGERQRMRQEESRRDFVNAMAHEMKTPLSVIRGFSENLLEDTVAEKRSYYLDQIVKQTEEMDDLVARMIGMTRLDSQNLVLQKEEVSVNDLLRELLKKYEAQIQKKKLQVQFSVREPFLLQGDPDYLQRAFASLVDNAVKYCTPGGSVFIETAADGCRLENSCGDPPDAQASQNRSGIGLYLAGKILSLHGVRLETKSVRHTFCARCVCGRAPARRSS